MRACFSCSALAFRSRSRQSSSSRALQLRSRSFATAAALATCLIGQWARLDSDTLVRDVPTDDEARLDSDTLVLIDRSARLVEPCACACRTKRSSRSAHGCLREIHRGSRSRFRPVRSPGTCSFLGLRDLGLLWVIGSGLPISTMLMTLHPWPQLALHPWHD